ncbi:MAG: hypothetical protein AAFW89_11035 [Bacteroidota bacterium]
MSKKKQSDAHIPDSFPYQLTNLHALLLCGCIGLGYIVYSFFSDGFYQQDEAAHFLNMRTFWFKPEIIMGNWAKPGYKLLFVIPALLGPMALVVVNSLVSALTCFITYKLAQRLKVRIPAIAIALLALQPFWLQLSFRNYSEPISALLLVSAVYAHYVDKRWIAALLLSYIATIRQEIYPIIALYGLFLLYKRNWMPVLLLASFPLVQHIAGWGFFGDPLYLFNQLTSKSASAAKEWPRQGFEHYFRMAPTIFGGVALSFLLVYAVQGVIKKQKWHWFVVIPALVYLAEHIVFNTKFLDLGPSTGGNLRYLIVVSPLFAVLGSIGIDRLIKERTFPEKRYALFVLVPFALLVFLFLSYAHNNIKLNPGEADYAPLVTVLLTMTLIFFAHSAKHWLYGTCVLIVISTMLVVRPLPRSAEDTKVAEFTAWAKQQDFEERPILATHTMMWYFWGKIREEFDEGAGWINEDTVAEAEPGSIIIWDSHYSYRPNLREKQLMYTWFLERPDQFKQVSQPWVTPDRRFGIFVFEKL